METYGNATSSLVEVAGYKPGPIVSRLLDIQKSKERHQKFLRYIKRLECLSLGETHERKQAGSSMQQIPLLRHWINAFHKRNYLALSYTWEPSEFEDGSKGRYEVQTRDKRDFYPSPVRNCVFDRIIAYMQHSGVKLLWIDRHSVQQQACRIGCNHKKCNDKRDAVQTMDLVYSLSHHPVALLGRPLESGDEVDLLARILEGKLVDESREVGGFQLSRATNRSEAHGALMLLNAITSDRWWTRAWTFQECYRAGGQMTLLIRHAAGLKRHERSYDLFGDLPGELCIKFVRFSSEATKLCQAFQRTWPRSMEESMAIHRVLETAGRYTYLLERSSAMFPTIIASIGSKGLGDDWDRLAIIANCCQYPIRLDKGELQQKAHSFDLSMLTMCLLNGEIINNGRTEAIHGSSPQTTVSTYLQTQFFNEFHGPRIDRSLTFNKGCRFINVELNIRGIMTEGHLWKLGRIVRTADFPDQLPWVKEPHGSLTLHQRKRLAQLARELRSLSHIPLARCIEVYLYFDSFDDDSNRFWQTAFPRTYMRMMAERLVKAIDKGETLRLGSLYGLPETVTPYKAIFIWEDDGDAPRFNTRGSEGSAYDWHAGEQSVPPTFAFTSSRPRKPKSRVLDSNDIDHYVSLEVEFTGIDAEYNAPRLYIRRWISGLCFFKGHPRSDVIFPWLPSVENIIP